MENLPHGAIGFIKTKKYEHFDQCENFCVTENIHYKHDIQIHEARNSDNNLKLYCVYLYSRISAIQVLEFMNENKLEYMFINIIGRLKELHDL